MTTTSPTAILLCGDPHGRFDHLFAAVQQHRPAALILLGDLQTAQPLEQALEPILDLTEIWFIHGNHDTDRDSYYDHVFGSTLAHRNLHGRVEEIAGVRVAGLGGIFRSQTWRPPAKPQYASPEDLLRRSQQAWLWRDGIARKHYSSIFPSDYERLAGQSADILVSHEAPSAHPYGYLAIDELARSLGASRSFHGHHHDSLDYRDHIQKLGFIPHGVGLRGICDLAGTPIRPGDLDERWSERQIDVR